MLHKSVLLKESIDGLSLEPGDIYLDATVGSGGHMEEVWSRMGSKAVLAGIDADEMSIAIAKERLELAGAHPRITVLNFRHIDQAPEILEIDNPTKIIFDLGWSTDQFDSPDEAKKRGFSFLKDEPLIMTFKQNPAEEDTTAYDVVNRWQEESLADIIYGYGEERYARRIAKRIVEERQKKPIETSLELAEIVKRAVPVFYRFGKIHPATRTFQAIRIAVNDELRALEEGLEKGFSILAPRGKMAVISFHSLEDRIVKRFFKLKQEGGEGELEQRGGKKPIVPAESEIKDNPRSRSAKLRIIQKK